MKYMYIIALAHKDRFLSSIGGNLSRLGWLLSVF